MRWESRAEESKANVAQWTWKHNCERSPRRRKDELLECWRWFICFLWEWKLAVDSSPLSVLNIWTDSGLASKHCVPLSFSQFLAFLFVFLVSLLALVAGVCSLRMYCLRIPPMGNVSGLSQVGGELLLGSVPVISVAQCPALLAACEM